MSGSSSKKREPKTGDELKHGCRQQLEHVFLSSRVLDPCQGSVAGWEQEGRDTVRWDRRICHFLP